ncbi:MAG: 3-methyl-2-oxobutanoate dehydrogenase subunit VorB [Candidatus Coatesbacteria bacterium]|nr:3-methyl-2-oxobutanoate dehydrogenase subunit VorB [Candidatus Coatesbacteria bacterium]
MAKQFIKGNDAIVKGALLAGCECYFGYPITPASEIAHAAAKYFPLLGRVFLQAESEIASIQMVYGASSAGRRVMTASSSPGISLKQEGISYCAGSELPCVIIDISRGGPGLGNIAPEQSDYFQIVKGGGHGAYKLLVLAPASAQEMCDLTMLAFDLAEKYRNPVCILADGYIGQMMEPVEFPEPLTGREYPDWAVLGNKETRQNLINSIYLDPIELENHILKLNGKYERMKKEEVRFEKYKTDDAEIICIGYGVVSRLLKSAIDECRNKGIKAGLLRPITLFPFPEKEIRNFAESCKSYFVSELSLGQMVEDVKLAVNGLKPVHFYGRTGGVVPSVTELYQQIEKIR